MDIHRRVLVALVTTLAMSAAACGSPSASPVGTAGEPAGSPGSSGFGALPSTILDPAELDELEAGLAADAAAAAGLSDAVGGPEMLDAVAELQRSGATEALAELLGEPVTASAAVEIAAATDKDPLAGQLAAVGTAPAPGTALSGVDFSGNLAVTTIFVNQVLARTPPSGEGSSSSATSTESGRVTAGGQTANVTVQTTLTIVRNGSTITGAADVTTTIELLDASGTVVETVTTTSHGVVEVDTCPAADGSANANYQLDYQVRSTGGQSADYHVSGRVVGQVLDDAYLHGFTVDASASTSNNAGVDRAVTVHGSVAMTGAPGDVTAIQVTQDTGQIVRADPQATMPDMVELGRLSVSPGFALVGLVFDTAQSQWRGGACVEVDVQPGTSDVDPNERFQPFVVIKSKIDGTILRGLPVKGTMTGGQSFTPADTDVSTPYAFTYVATGRLGDVGKVHFITTSRRGIGELDVEYTVTTDLVLELEIQSTYDFTKYNNFLSDARVEVKGVIRLERDPVTNLWSGEGTLTSTSSSRVSGCNSITIAGSGTYDWVVREARAEPGMPDSQLEVWMDNGTDDESFDNFTARICPAGSTTGHVNLWENIFFLTESHIYYGAKGFRVANFDSLGANTATWSDGLVLGTIGWQGNCENIPPVVLPSGFPSDLPGLDVSKYTACVGNTYYTLRVVDPGP